MTGVRSWQRRPKPGRMINHPAVLIEARREYDGVRPQKRVVGGLTIVTYSRPRVYLDRDAWEMLPDDGVLLIRVRPSGGRRFALALTARELEHTFGEVRFAASWENLRCYHFPKAPPAARAFLVHGSDDWHLDPHARARALSAPTAGSNRSDVRPPRASSRRAIAASLVRAPTGGSFADWSAWWYRRLGALPEDASYLAGVTAWRDAWRPSSVRALLIAESHVAERSRDLRARVLSKELGIDGLPTQYVRLVYCLGYGESEICRPQPPQNSGTIQYWDILGQVARDEDQPRKRQSTLAQRLSWKLSVLRELQDRGIWLQDASPLGIYLGRGVRVDAKLQLSLVRDGYQRWVWPSVADDPVERVWVIGSGVNAALSGLPGIDPARFITQPQDRDAGRHRAGLKQMRRDLDDLP